MAATAQSCSNWIHQIRTTATGLWPGATPWASAF